MTGADWLRPGIHDAVPMEDYLADPCREPSLSAGIAHLLVERSPLHAWTQHPKLNPEFQRVEEQKFDLGTVVHAALLQGTDICEPVDANDWRTQAAKDARDEARADGRIPLLAKDWQRVGDMSAAITRQLAERDDNPPLFAGGLPEQTLVWQEDGVWCRARLDWLTGDHRHIADLKTTSASAHPETWSRRTMWSIGCDLQVALYLRGLKALTGKDATFRYVVAECQPPYALSVVSLAPSALELGQQKTEWAIWKWRDCLRSGVWPAYDKRLVHAEAPEWETARWLERTYEEAAA